MLTFDGDGNAWVSLEFLMVARAWLPGKADLSMWPAPADVARRSVKKSGTARLGVGKAEAEASMTDDSDGRPYYVVKVRARVDDAEKLTAAAMDETGHESMSMPNMLMSVLVEPAWGKSGFEALGFRMERDSLETVRDEKELKALIERGKLASTAAAGASPSRKRKI